MDNVVKLRHEVDTSQSVKAAEDVEKSWVRAHLGMGKAVDGTTSSLRKMQIAATASIGAITAGAAAAQGSWVTVGTTVLASFAAGGPIGGAIALLGAGVGFLLTETEKADSSIRDITKSTMELRKEAERLRRENEGVLKIDVVNDQIREQTKALENLKSQIDRSNEGIAATVENTQGFAKGIVTREVKRMESILAGQKEMHAATDTNLKELRALSRELGRAQNIEAGLARASTNIALGRQVEVLEARSDFAKFTAQLEAQLLDLSNHGGAPGLLTRFRNATTDDFFGAISEQMDSQADALGRQVALLNELNPRERARLQIQQELSASMDELTKLANSLPTSAPVGVLEAVQRARDAAQGAADARNAAIDRASPLGRITQQIGPQLSSAIAQAGATGFKTWEGAAQQFATSLQGMLLNAVASAALFNILGGATGMGGALFGSGFIPLFGDGGIVTRPTLAIVGEKGPEEIRPLNKPSMLRGGDTFNIPITVHNGDGQTIQRLEAMVDRIMQRRRRQIRGRLGPGL